MPHGAEHTLGMFAWMDGIEARLHDLYVNVKQAPYNAVGNGVSDDTAAIQSALNAAGGGTVFLPRGPTR